MISDLVIVRYCKAPTKLLYLVGSSRSLPKVVESWMFDTTGVAIGLEEARPNLCNRSEAYFFCVIVMLVEDEVISRPRK